ncbi:TolC family protein [Bdellovibrio sp. SKB1291214]|uniref:TolC family protein n=1 Tax=Bdellovibrio sp. SKB1291214 TaxID=1732569 RepID=UPI000B5159AC|nr:TolC family protein [Bdellovibrio sp. SKB1291214]UYL09889.1 TolC family protein [Bdellovibrio sp. SKB1291214]
MRIFMVLFLKLTLLSPFASAEDKLSIHAFLDKVQAQNLDLKVEQAKLESAEAQSSAIGLPPPMVSISKLTEKEGSSAQGFEVSQMIPFPGKLIKDKSSRNLEAQTQKLVFSTKQKELQSEAILAFYEYWATSEKILILKQRNRILSNHLKLARSGVRSDSSLKLHLLKTESDLDLLENDLETANQDLEEKRLKMAVLMNLPSSTKIPEPEEPPLSSLPAEPESTIDLPQLKVSELQLQTLTTRESEAKQSWFPDFTLSYKEMGATQMMPQYSEIMVGMTLPFLFAWEPSSEVKKASAQRHEAELQYEKMKQETNSLRSISWTRARSIRKQLTTLQEKIIPKAHKRMQLINNIAPRDMESLQDHRETMETFSDLQLKVLDLRLSYEKSLSELEKWIPISGAANE